MERPLKRSVTFETWSEESITLGEPIESGFVFDSEPITLRDLLTEIRHNGNQWAQETWDGLMVEHYPCENYHNGETTIETMHVECSPRNARRILKLIKNRILLNIC